MNIKARFLAIAFLVIGLLVILLYQASQSVTRPLINTPVGIVFTPTRVSFITPTGYSSSDAEVSIVLTTTAARPVVGEVFTVAAMIGNVGKLEVRNVSFGLDIYLEDGARQYQSSLEPMTEPLYVGKSGFTTSWLPGKSYVFEFPFRALRPGRGVLSGGISGNIWPDPTTSELIMGWESTLAFEVVPSLITPRGE